MAFKNKGATWYQADDKVRNPYFGAMMLECADRVEKLRFEGRETKATPAPHQHN
jgi:Cu(I)/Ag(I) efflux system membrane fusion protein